MVENTPLALLPLIAGILVLAARFYVREGAISIFSMSFILATIAVLMLVGLHGAARSWGICRPTPGLASAASACR